MRDVSFKEDRTVLENWENTGLLAGLTDNVKENIANCLEAQRLFNEQEPVNPQWRRISIPVIRRIAGAAVFGRNRFVLESTEAQPEVYMFNAKSGVAINTIDTNGNMSLSAEAEATAVLAEDLAKELDAAFNDQYNKNIYFRGLNRNETGDICMFYNLN